MNYKYFRTTYKDWVCARCGREYDLHLYDQRYPECQIMARDGVCFECAYWEHFSMNMDPDCEVISGAVYKIIGSERFHIHGMDTRKTTSPFYLFAIKERVFFSANTIWLQEIVPPRFRDIVPDTAVFVSAKRHAFYKSCVNFDCRKKGCFDRYSCALYNAQLETEPWNVIAKSHKTGDEKCPDFINISKESSDRIMAKIFKNKRYYCEGEGADFDADDDADCGSDDNDLDAFIDDETVGRICDMDIQENELEDGKNT